VRRSFVARVLARRLHRALPPRERALAWADANDPALGALVLDVASFAFRLPGQPTWKDLSGKRSLFRILGALAAPRARGVDEVVGADALAAALWPGEGREGAAHLVDAEVIALRAAGLGALVQGRAQGYALDPALLVLEVPRTL
jgi:hypothetical protein